MAARSIVCEARKLVESVRGADTYVVLKAGRCWRNFHRSLVTAHHGGYGRTCQRDLREK